MQSPAIARPLLHFEGGLEPGRLRKVELPIAFPEILLGINQTIMMALAMVAITALIGSRDLGQEIYKALPGADMRRVDGDRAFRRNHWCAGSR